MPHHIELVAVGADLYSILHPAIAALNSAQVEFSFAIPPASLRRYLIGRACSEYKTDEVWAWLEEYREHAKGHRPFIIGFVSEGLRSARLSNLFGSTCAEKGLALVTTKDHTLYVRSIAAYCSYYLTRYSLSFLAPTIKAHDETRACFFDKKIRKDDLRLSLASGRLCEQCSKGIAARSNDEIAAAIVSMTETVRALEFGPGATAPATTEPWLLKSILNPWWNTGRFPAYEDFRTLNYPDAEHIDRLLAAQAIATSGDPPSVRVTWKGLLRSSWERLDEALSLTKATLIALRSGYLADGDRARRWSAADLPGLSKAIRVSDSTRAMQLAYDLPIWAARPSLDGTIGGQLTEQVLLHSIEASVTSSGGAPVVQVPALPSTPTKTRGEAGLRRPTSSS